VSLKIVAKNIGTLNFPSGESVQASERTLTGGKTVTVTFRLSWGFPLASPAEAQISAYGMVALSSYGFSYQG
jgi:hypothetical protein